MDRMYSNFMETGKLCHLQAWQGFAHGIWLIRSHMAHHPNFSQPLVARSHPLVAPPFAAARGLQIAGFYRVADKQSGGLALTYGARHNSLLGY